MSEQLIVLHVGLLLNYWIIVDDLIKYRLYTDGETTHLFKLHRGTCQLSKQEQKESIAKESTLV